MHSVWTFDFCLYISSEDKALRLTEHSDCNALLTNLATEGVISDAIASDKRAAANQVINSCRYNDLSNGATFIRLHAALTFLHKQSNENIVNFIKDTHSDRRNQSITIKMRRPWSLIIYPCQKMTAHGAMPPMIPSLGNTRSRGELIDFKTERLWTLCASLIQIECLWNYLASQKTFCTSYWIGWLLSFCLANVSQQ